MSYHRSGAPQQSRDKAVLSCTWRLAESLTGESFGGMLERAFAARFGSADAAPGHPLGPSNRAAPASAADEAGAAPGVTAAGRPADTQQQVVRPDVPSPGDATLAAASGPEHGKPKDPDVPLPTGGRVPRYVYHVQLLRHPYHAFL
jgi:hypothetical protein